MSEPTRLHYLIGDIHEHMANLVGELNPEVWATRPSSRFIGAAGSFTASLRRTAC